MVLLRNISVGVYNEVHCKSIRQIKFTLPCSKVFFITYLFSHDKSDDDHILRDADTDVSDDDPEQLSDDHEPDIENVPQRGQKESQQKPGILPVTFGRHPKLSRGEEMYSTEKEYAKV